MKHLSLRFKIILILIITIIFLSSTLIFVAISKSSSSMKDAHFDQLKAITETQSQYIISYFDNLKNLLILQSKTSFVANAIEDFGISFEDLKCENLPIKTKNCLTYLLTNKDAKSKSNNLYFIIYDSYHNDFIKLLTSFELRNIYLVDNKGNVVYSALNEPDLGTNLLTKEKNGLINCYKKILNLKKEQIAFANFDFYKPANNIPVAFIGTPVFIENQFIGAIIFQVTIKKLNSILRFNGKYEEAGLGKTGEVYLVGNDYKILNDSRFLNELDNPLVKERKTTIKILEIKTPSIINALQGKSGVNIITSYRGKKVLSSYKGLNIFGEPLGIIAEIEENEAFADIFKTSKFIIITSTTLTIIAILLSLSFLRGLFTRKLNEVALMVENISNILNEKVAVIEAIREGLIAIDSNKRITLINHAASVLLKIEHPENIIGEKIDNFVEIDDMEEVLHYKEPIYDTEFGTKEGTMVANIVPILDKDKIIGAVASFRKKDEIYHLAKELSSTQQYSDMLRAQTHEFSNTLHTIAGLIQTEAYQEALELITKKTQTHENFIKTLSNIVEDPLISGIIIGKYNYAQELQIKFVLDENSHMKDIPKHIDREKIITIIGNLLDNAFESVLQNKSKPKIVSISMTDYGRDLIFEIEDSGAGIDPTSIEKLFQKGYSSKKEKGRGFGLYIVTKRIRELNGSIEIEESELGGAAFTVIIPKNIEVENE